MPARARRQEALGDTQERAHMCVCAIRTRAVATDLSQCLRGRKNGSGKGQPFCLATYLATPERLWEEMRRWPTPHRLARNDP
eukprot:13554698-Alexandrium_andersonii.AAC.1